MGCTPNSGRKQPQPEYMEYVKRAFLMAHLLTGDIDQAERATMEAIDSWNPDRQTGAGLEGVDLTAAADRGYRGSQRAVGRHR